MNARWRKNKVTFSDDDFVKLHEKRYEEKDCTLLLSLTAAETSTLAEKCHMKGVTVNSVLLTALLTAKYAVPALAEVIPDKLRVAVNLRDKLTEDPGRGCGFYAGWIPLHARFNPKKDFERNLLTIHSEVARKIHDNRELFKGLMGMEMIDPSLFDALAFESYGMLENPMTKRFRRNMAKSSAGITLTNLGRQEFPERFGDLKVRKIIFLAPAPGPFKILQASALTASGCLHAAFSYTESIFPTTVMRDYVNAVKDSLRGFIAID